jgi:molybdopterin-guanine dinucleotide biosynthesis protein A
MGGVIKPFLVVDGRRIIDRQLEVLRGLFDAVAIVVGAEERTLFHEQHLGVDVLADRAGPGLGPLAGLDAAFAWLPERFDSVVCVAGDMPFLAAPVLERLRDAAPDGACAVIPWIDGRAQFLCARYHRGLSALVAAEIAAGTRAMHVFLERVKDGSPAAGVVWLDEAELRRRDPMLATFTNVNEPADLLGVVLGHASRRRATITRAPTPEGKPQVSEKPPGGVRRRTGGASEPDHGRG